MKTNNLSKAIWPHVIALGVFLLFTMIFFKPAILDNKALVQHDAFQGRAAAHEIKENREKGENPLWVNSMFSGMPAYLINVSYKDEVVTYLSKAISLWLPGPGRYVFLSFLSYYVMLLSFGVRRELALGGALVFGLATFNLISISAGHNSKIHAVSYLPLVVAGIRFALSKKMFLGFAVTALGVSMELKANHLQMTYYLLLLIAIYGATELFFHLKEKQLDTFFKAIGVLGIAAVLGLLTNFGRIWTVYEYGKYTIRGESELTEGAEEGNTSGLDKEYAFRYSNGIAEPLVMFVPNILGGSSQQSLDSDSHLGKALQSQGYNRTQVVQQLQSVPTYWGGQPLTAPFYIGAVSLLLLGVGLIYAPRRHLIWLVTASVFGIVLTWGKSFEAFNYFMFDYFPGYNKFRSVTFAIIIPTLCLPLLGLLGLEKLFSEGLPQKLNKKHKLALGIPFGFILFLLLLSGTLSYRGAIDERLSNLPNWFLEALRADRKSLFRADVFRTLVFMILIGVVSWFYVGKKLGNWVFAALFTLLVGVDISAVGKRFLKNDDFKKDPYGKFVQPTQADNYINKVNEESARVIYLLNPFNEAKTSIHHASIGGYHGAKLGRYQDLISYGLEAEIQQVIDVLRSGGRDFGSIPLLNMLNTGYFLAGEDKAAVFANPSANGHAWFVEEVVAVVSAKEEMQKLKTIDTKKAAVIDVSKFQKPDFFTQGEISMVDKTSNTVSYVSESSSDGFAVFSEVFYEKGWKAYINEEETDIIRANYVLRGLSVPAGKNTIKFVFKPSSYHIGTVVSRIASYILLVVLVVAVAYCWKGFKKSSISGD